MPPKDCVSPSDPNWFRLLHSCRWPFTVLLSTWLLVSGASRLLRQPIPVRVEGGVSLDKVSEPILVQSESPLRVTGAVVVANQGAIKVAAEEIVVRQPIAVEATRGIPVMAEAPIPVNAVQPVSVMANEAIPVKALEAIPVSTGGPVSARVVVDAVNGAIDIQASDPLPVKGDLDIHRINDPVRVNARGMLFPFSVP
jgi:hypothetical protein